MATNSRKISTCLVATGLTGTDRIFTIATANSITNNALITAANLFSNTNIPFVTVGNNAVSTANLIVRTSSAPVNSAANGVQGQFVYDSGFLYVCVANNSWKRAALTTF